MTGWRDRRYKRSFDIVVLLCAHVLALPVWLLFWTVIPLAIVIGDGRPIFYVQLRVGRGGKVFKMRKFRTMKVGAEDDSGPVWAQPDDVRITRVGRILRQTALDELPQVINIWKGEMSFVGPRSERPELHRKIAEKVNGFDRRLEVRPGLTGLAQIRGSYDLSPRRKLAYDLLYVKNQGILLDIKLMGYSIGKTITGRWGPNS